MVYIGNIIKIHQKLAENQTLTLCYRSGRASILNFDDNLEKVNGELKIERKGLQGTTIIIIDCAEVESICLK